MSGIMFAEMFHKGQPMLKVLPELLKDQTTGKNIVWATDTYSSHGSKYKKDTVPFGVPEDEFIQLSLFEITEENKPVYCKIKDWRSKIILEYRSMKKGTGA